MKILFLDINGVLTADSLDGSMEFSSEASQCLQRILKAVPECRIVVSSSFRKMHDRADLFRLLSQATGTGEDRFLDYTPVLPGRARCFEIQQWLASHPDTSAFVILDDRPIGPLLGDWLVPILSGRGMLSEHADAAIRILNT